MHLNALCKRRLLPASKPKLKLLLIMNFTAIILLSACLTVSAKSISQNVTLSEKNSPLEKVFKEIKKQTGYTFFFNEEVIKKAENVTIQVTNMPLQMALELCFKKQPLTFTIVGNTIVVKEKETEQKKEQPEETIAIKDIKGRVINEDGEPIRATITVKGTNIATSTNDNGEFELKGLDENATLVITGVSIETREIKVNKKTDLEITVNTKITSQQEVTVKTNYWETKKRQNPGNISKVISKDIEKNPVSNPLAAMQGRVAGLEVTQATGVPGGNFTVRIRGRNSIANGNDPYYIIDGVPFTSVSQVSSEASTLIIGPSGGSPLNSISPSDIESIEILKDADATAIYGSRGANGVVLITTKKGKAGKTKVDFNFYTGAGKVSKKIDMMNTQQYLEMRREAFANDNILISDPSTYAPDLKNWDTTRYTDWQKVLLGGTANTLDAQMSVSGGNTNTQFLVGGGYHRETTVFPGDNADQRSSVHFNINNVSPNQRFHTSFSASYSANTTNFITEDFTETALRLAPNAPALYNANGGLNWENSTWSNPLRILNSRYGANTNNLIGNAIFSYDILPGLELKTSLGYNTMSMKANSRNPTNTFDPAYPAFNYSVFANRNLQSWIIEPQLNWKTKVGDGNLNVLIGSTFHDQKTEGLAQFGYGFPNDALLGNIAAASSSFILSSNYAQYRYNAIFGRVNYNLKEKYVFNITGRRDGSSRFGPGRQFASFGAIGTAWIFSKESFVQNSLDFLSYGKLRASYGTSGNDQIGDYQYLDRYTPSGPYQGISGLNPASLFNPDFAWEENKKLEVAVELGFAKDRILLDVSYYRNRSSNQLVGYPLPPTTGFNSLSAYNQPAIVQNTGLEFELNTINIKNSNITWTTAINLTIPRNKLIAYPNIKASAYDNRYAVGEPLSIRKSYHFTGVNSTTGIYEFQDVNGDGILSPSDQQTIIFAGQNFYGGIQSKLEYRGFQLDILFQFVKQTCFDFLRSTWAFNGDMANQPVTALDRWQKPGDNSQIQRFTSSYSPAAIAYFSNYASSDRAVIDASFMRLKNLSLSYLFPKDWTKKLHIESGRIFIQGQNLLTITKFTGLDPESQQINLPPLRVLTAGIHFTF